MTIIWAVITLVLVVSEIATTALVCIWFAVGSFAALITSMFDVSVLLQCVIFVIVSIIAVILMRPFARKVSKPKEILSMVAKKVTITEEVTQTTGKGIIGDVTWNVRLDSGEKIAKGESVEVVRVEGTTLYVTMHS